MSVTATGHSTWPAPPPLFKVGNQDPHCFLVKVQSEQGALE